MVKSSAPTITGAPDRAANSNDWYAGDVTVTYTCDDALSGIALAGLVILQQVLDLHEWAGILIVVTANILAVAAAQAQTRTTSSVTVLRTTSAVALAPMRTVGPVGNARPVMVTSVPPAVSTRFGLSDVIRKGPTSG